MQIKAILVGALLATQEKLAKLGSPKACSDQAFVVHVLIHRENGDCAISWIRECHVGRIAGTTSAAGVHVVCVDDNLFDFTVLSEQVQASERALLRDIRRQSDYIHQRLLNNSQIREPFDLLSRQLTDHDSIARRPGRITKLLHRLNTYINQRLPTPAINTCYLPIDFIFIVTVTV